jgi:ribonuclease P protein component
VKRRFRLTKSADFKRVRRLGKAYPHPLIVLIALPNELTISRFAVAAGRSVGNAVKRNRAKRLMREVLNKLLPDIPPGWDILLIARQPMSAASFSQTEQAVRLELQHAGLLNQS